MRATRLLSMLANSSKPKKKKSAEVEELRLLLARWSEAYYNDGSALVSDSEFDAVRARLARLDPSSVEEGPVGAAVASGARRWRHARAMASLQSGRREEELQEWRAATERACEESRIEWASEMKYDGMALALHYDRSGKLVRGVTRGDGDEGEEVELSRLEKHLEKGVQVEMGVLDEECEVRGELLVDKRQFEELRREGGYRSARNAVVGLVKGKEEPPPGTRLRFIAFGLESEKTRHADHSLKVGLLREMGLETCPHLRVHSEWASVLEELRAWSSAEKRDRELEFEVDGMVVKVNSRRLSDALGSTRHHPRHSMAMKWSSSLLPTTVLSGIEWHVDQLGHLRPVALVDPPVHCQDGAMLSRASLHNWAFVLRHGLVPGTSVQLERSGGTVPHLVPFPVSPSSPVPSPPSHCPCPLAAPLLSSPPLHLCCSNFSCPERAAYRAHALASLLGVRGMGLSSARQFAHAGLLSLSRPWGLLSLASSSSSSLVASLGRGWGTRRVESLLSSLSTAVSSASFSLALASLPVSGLGSSAWEQVASAYPSLELLSRASVADLMGLPQVGTLGAQQIVAQVNPDTLSDLRRTFLEVGLPISSSESPSSSSSSASSLPLRGMQVVVSGTLSVPRAQLAARVRQAGGSVVAAVSGKTRAMVAGEGAVQEKVEKAKRLGVPVESEEQFEKRFHS